jgi:pSer/pThr/pTyr-binding forkhead associated (FHA) protein
VRTHVYCSECGFLSPATASYCPRCGAVLTPESGPETTMSLEPDASGNEQEAALASDAVGGPVLVVRSGGGIAGQTFHPPEGKTLIGRSPECQIFFDDVTVSRRHAELDRQGDTFSIRDLGSLNGTYVNRRRIESTVLQNDDEVQIGKYRLTFLQR